MKKSEALRLLDSEQLKENHRKSTRRSYASSVADYCDLLRSGKVKDFQGYLDHLATEKLVATKTIKNALCALIFFHKHVLQTEVGKLRVPKGRTGRRNPTWLSHAECLDILSRLDRVPRLQCALMYGCGLRISEMISLRLKDIDFEGGMLSIRSAKGDKDRMVRLPQSLIPEIREQVRRAKLLWQRDNAAGLMAPIDSPSLMRKLGPNVFRRASWYWLFPSRAVSNGERWHASTSGVAKSLQIAVEAAGILKRVCPHTFRHSYATNLLKSGVDIRTLQDQLGHAHVETTEIYTHAVGARGTASPLDRADLAAEAPNITPFRRIA